MNLAGIAFIVLMALVLIAAAIHTSWDERRQSGVSGAIEPRWTDGYGDRTHDGSAIWINRGRSNQ
jgi:hypothetical protein